MKRHVNPSVIIDVWLRLGTWRDSLACPTPLLIETRNKGSRVSSTRWPGLTRKLGSKVYLNAKDSNTTPNTARNGDTYFA